MYKDPKNRPVNLNLFAFKFPLNAILSITHRITGIALVIFIIEILVCLFLALNSNEQFTLVINFLANPFVWAFNLVSIIVFCYHWLMGVRHLIEDYHLDKGVVQYLVCPMGSLAIFVALSILITWSLLL